MVAPHREASIRSYYNTFLKIVLIENPVKPYRSIICTVNVRTAFFSKLNNLIYNNELIDDSKTFSKSVYCNSNFRFERNSKRRLGFCFYSANGYGTILHFKRLNACSRRTSHRQ